jgi:hypothetical protein
MSKLGLISQVYQTFKLPKVRLSFTRLDNRSLATSSFFSKTYQRSDLATNDVSRQKLYFVNVQSNRSIGTSSISWKKKSTNDSNVHS